MNVQFIEAPKLAQEQRLTVLAFRSRFTDTERTKLYTTAKTVVEIQIYLDDLAAAVTKGALLTDPRTIAGVMALEASGMLDYVGRSEVILKTVAAPDELF